MKLNTSTEKVLYWIYKSPTLYTEIDRQSQINTTVKDLSLMFSGVAGENNSFFNKNWKQADEAWNQFAINAENFLRFFEESGVLDCDLCAGLDNVRLLDITPEQAVKNYRKIVARQEKALQEFLEAA